MKFSSLFRGVTPEVFDRRVKNMFRDLQREWNGVPFDVVNDGDVTALMGAMSLHGGGVLGIALGTSTAGGYVTAEGHITPWLNEIAFVPIDYRLDAPRDEWSGDVGCCVQYLSQQAVGRLLRARAHRRVPESMTLPARLKVLQSLMAAGDPRAARRVPDDGRLPGLRRRSPGERLRLPLPAGSRALYLRPGRRGHDGRRARGAARGLPGARGSRSQLRMPGEKEKRHGQAMAAASLPELGEAHVTA